MQFSFLSFPFSLQNDFVTLLYWLALMVFWIYLLVSSQPGKNKGKKRNKLWDVGCM